MQLEVLADAEKVARRAAVIMAEHARAAFEARGRFIVALSGGHTPWIMLRMLTKEEVPWGGVYVLQVDERIAPAGDPDRNLTHLRETLLENAPIDPAQIYPIPVETPDPRQAVAEYSRTLEIVAGSPPILDLVHLGLGPDGHTASLVPGDPVLHVDDKDVAITGTYQGRKRITLTYPVINRARQILWVVTGSEKAKALWQLESADLSIPGGWIRRDQSLVLADEAAAGAVNRGAFA
jgi:6-phosphogluconolactonase